LKTSTKWRVSDVTKQTLRKLDLTVDAIWCDPARREIDLQ